MRDGTLKPKYLHVESETSSSILSSNDEIIKVACSSCSAAREVFLIVGQQIPNWKVGDIIYTNHARSMAIKPESVRGAQRAALGHIYPAR